MLLVREPEQLPCSKRRIPHVYSAAIARGRQDSRRDTGGHACRGHDPTAVSQAIKRSRCRGQRRRNLPAELLAVAFVVLGLFAGGTLRDAVRKTHQGLRLRTDFPGGEPAGKGSICNTRYRYGPRLLRELFTRVCQPLAPPDTPGTFLFGLRLMALDGTLERVANTPASVKAFGRWKGPRGPAAYPLLTCVDLEECGTHAVVGALVRPCTASEQGAGWVLLKRVSPETLLLVDSAHCCSQTIAQAQAQRVHVLTRANANLTLKPVQMLPDGTSWEWMDPGPTKGLRGKCVTFPPLVVRVIRYEAPDPKHPDGRIIHRLVTALLDESRSPARDLIVADHERWGVENVADEIDTHLRAERPILGSHKPAGVVQEVYGILLAHSTVRKVMFEAAQEAGVDPDRVSFVGTLRLIRDALPDLNAASTHQARARRYAVLVRAAAKERNPPRRPRSYPRVVKRKMSKSSSSVQRSTDLNARPLPSSTPSSFAKVNGIGSTFRPRGRTMSRLPTIFLRAVLLRCPNCGGGSVFASWFTLKSTCPTCGLWFQRGEEGYFLGAMAINLVVGESIPIFGLLAAWILAFPSPPSTIVVVSGFVGAVALPLLFFPFSRTLWLALDLSVRPADARDLVQRQGADANSTGGGRE
jgi:uncharacterized protein (DUF983 family)